MSPAPNLRSFRKELAAALGDEYRLGRKGIHRDIDSFTRLSITPDTNSVSGHRGVGASIVLYRKQDWIDWLGQYQQDVEMEFAGNAEGGDFGFMIGPEYLLERPHAHRWCIDDAPALQASVRHVSELIRTRLEPLIPRLVERLPNTKGFLAGQDFLEIPKKARLGMREKCPWAPCVEPGRRLDAGGVVRLGDGFPEYSTGSS